jgi:hypothetical protein
MIPVFNIPTTPQQLARAMQLQSNIIFDAGVGAVVAAGEQAVTEYAKYQAGITASGALANYVQPDPGITVSALNTPVMGNLDISAGSYTYPDGHGGSVKYNYPAITINTVLFQVSQQKNIIKTYVQGLSGSVKEYIAKQDYTVSIQGVITGTNGVYPAQDVQALQQVLIAPVALVVNSGYLSRLNISRLVVESWNWTQTPGSYSYQGFNIDCISDIPIPITVNQSPQ